MQPIYDTILSVHHQKASLRGIIVTSFKTEKVQINNYKLQSFNTNCYVSLFKLNKLCL